MPKSPLEYFTRPLVRISTDAEGNEVTFRQLIAVIVLCSAAAHIDGVLMNTELQTTLDIIVEEFGVSEEYAAELYQIAEYLLMDHKNVKKYVDVINSTYREDQRRRVLELVMKITAADGELGDQEALFRSKLKKLFKLRPL